MEEQEKEFSSQESLELITRMIGKARQEYCDTGLSSLLWGSVITICSLVTFFNYYLNIKWEPLNYIWFLTIGAVVPQVIISIRESRIRKLKAYEDDFVGGVWISFAIAIFMLSYYINKYDLNHVRPLYLIVYGIPTFTTGYARRFRPMIIGGIACWVLAVVSEYTPFPYNMICTAAAAQLAWFIPGLILRSRYLKAKRQHV